MTMQSEQVGAGFPFEKKGFLFGFAQQWRIVTALLVRETATRFGRRNAGFVWAFIEPLAYITFFLTLHGFIRQRVPYGESAIVFFVAGLLAFRLYISMANRTLAALSSNQALLNYPMVRPLDPIIARAILEATVMLVVAAIVIIFMTYYLERDIILNPVGLISGLALTAYLGFAMGAFNAVFSILFTPWASINSILGLPLFFLSGLLYVPSAMPPEIIAIINWNPVLHCVEVARSGFYVNYLSLASPVYPFAFATIVLTLALFIERTYRNRIIRQ